MEEFSSKIATLGPGKIHIALSGYINETSEMPDLSGKAIKSLVIDFESVKFINSAGILQWITWITEVVKQYPECSLTYKRCPRVIVEQMNNIRGFLPASAYVDSFYIPFYCQKCNTNKDLLLIRKRDIAQMGGQRGKIKYQAPVCGDSDCEMAIDVVEDRYLKFTGKG